MKRTSSAVALAMAAGLIVHALPSLAQGGVCVSGQRCPTCPPEPCATTVPPGGGNQGGWNDPAPTVASDPAAPFFNQGQSALERNDPSAAEASYTQALRLNPNHGAAWNGLGVALVRQSRGEEALRAFGRASQLGVPQAAANYQKIDTWLKQKSDWLEKNKQYAKSLIGKGIDLLKAGKYSEARTAFATARNFDPSNGDAIAAGPYLDALERERNRTNAIDARRRDEELARQRAAAGNPLWIGDTLGYVAKKLRHDLAVGDSVALAGLQSACAQDERQPGLGCAAFGEVDGDATTVLMRNYFDTERTKRGERLKASGLGPEGTQIWGAEEKADLPGAPRPAPLAPVLEKAEAGIPLTAGDLATLEREKMRLESVRAAAANAAVIAEPGRQEAARRDVERLDKEKLVIEIRMVGSAPDTPPRRKRFPEIPEPQR